MTVSQNKYLDVDFLAALASFAWAVAALFTPQLGQLVSYQVALAFSTAAATRWYSRHTGNHLKALEAPVESD